MSWSFKSVFSWSALRLVVALVASLFVSQTLVLLFMLALVHGRMQLSPHAEALLVASVNLVFAIPIVYLFEFRPLKSRIAECVEAEACTRVHNEQLKAAVRDREAYLAVLAHDLRSPLTVLLGTLEIIDDKRHGACKCDEDGNAAIRHAMDAATRLNAFMNDLLSWASMKKGVHAFHAEPCDLSAVVSAAAMKLGEAAAAKGVSFAVNAPAGVVVHGDAMMLEAVARNLMSNGKKFTPRGGRVSVAVRKTEGGAVLSVSDNGIGMPREIVENLFVPDGTQSRKGTEGEPGVGLGLFLCDEFVRRHGGSIAVTSEVGVGTTFRVELPDSASSGNGTEETA